MLKSRDIAKELHVSEGTVRAYARDGLIPFVTTPGGHRRYMLDEVRAALAMAKKHTIEPLEDGETPRLAEQAPATPMRLGRSRRRGITRAAIADAPAATSDTPARIPFIGVQGSSRFIVGQQADI